MIYVKCNICGLDEWRVRYPATEQKNEKLDVSAFSCTSVGYGSHAQIVQCIHCGHVYANPRHEPEQLLEAYEAVEDEIYLRERVGRERTFAKHLHSLERFSGPGNGRHLLDVGAYVGIFVEIATTKGWQAMGVEPSYWAARKGAERGLPVIQGTLDASEIFGRRFDAITMWDVIEHMDDPSAELAKSYQLLQPGGYIAVHTMDIASPIARLMGSRWPWLMDMHLHYFDRQTLCRLLEQNGFEITWVGAEGRYLTLRYLVSRVSAVSRPIGRIVGQIVRSVKAEDITVPINLGDLFTVYARRPIAVD